MGEKLIVAVNSDKSVHILKGANRPINNEESRSRILASLEFVDMVVLINGETPEKIISKLVP